MSFFTMLPSRVLIRNVDLWQSSGVRQGVDAFVENGRIVSLEDHNTTENFPKPKVGWTTLSQSEVIDGHGRALLPMGIDAQVHLRVPGQAEKETPMTGLRAALRGGYGALLTMPNTKPVIDSPESVALARAELAEAERLCGVKVLISAAMTMGQEGRKVVLARELKDAGVSALTDDGRGVADDEVMLSILKASAETGLPVLQHAEIPGHGCSLAEGPLQRRLGLKAYPAEAEWGMVERDLRLLREVPGARYHVLHVSCAKTVDFIAAAKDQGLQVTAEVSPHHLFFSSDDVVEGNTSFKMNPPLRSVKDRAVLRQALREGVIDFVATDHAPHEVSLKGHLFESSAFGTTGMESALRVLWTLMGSQALMSTPRLIEVFSSAPAKFLALEAQGFGSLREGDLLRAVLFDPSQPARDFEISELESLSKNNCFLGARLSGRVDAVFNEAGLFRFATDTK